MEGYMAGETSGLFHCLMPNQNTWSLI